MLLRPCEDGSKKLECFISGASSQAGEPKTLSAFLTTIVTAIAQVTNPRCLVRVGSLSLFRLKRGFLPGNARIVGKITHYMEEHHRATDRLERGPPSTKPMLSSRTIRAAG